MKLAPKFYGPCQILDRVGTVAYRLELPSTSRIHPTFHVSQLKKHVGSTVVHSTLPPVTSEGTFDMGPLKTLKHRKVYQGGKVIYQYLVQWKHGSMDDATWENEDMLQFYYPDLSLNP